MINNLKNILKYNKYCSPEQIEQDFNVPVFGVIPWLDDEIYDEPDVMFAMDEAISSYSLAFQRAVSCLKLKGNNLNKKVFAFTSSELSKYRSTIIMNTAYSLSRAGESVIVVDADFRTPSIGRDLGLKTQNRGELTELLINFSEEINHSIYSIQGIKNFYIIPNNGSSMDPAPYLYSDEFKLLIKELRTRYNWVFIDIPPALAVPDIFMISPCVDGIILLTGLNSEKAVIKRIHSQFKNFGLKIFGVIMREMQIKEASSENPYIKQMVSQMMGEPHEKIRP